MKNQYSILIPAYNPDSKLLKLLDSLKSDNVEKILIVNDGSKTRAIFNKIEEKKDPKICIVDHSINMGKGAALKTGLNYLYANTINSVGVVTADADGQHIPEDIFEIGKKLIENPSHLILGYRIFGKNTPLRSRLGNDLTRYIFSYLLRLPIKDTQSGLRGIPLEKIKDCLNIKYNNYEFETEMLLKAKKDKKSIIQIPIHTIYIDDNKSSHFNPIKDSFKIYLTIFKFMISSLLSVIIEYVSFAIFLLISNSIVESQIVARTISATFNFFVNKEKVFNSKSTIYMPLFKYILLAIFLGTASYFIIIFLVKNYSINVFIAKIIAEVGLFFISYLVQKSIVFVEKEI